MALPTAYMTSTKRLPEIFDAIRTAKAPEKFTQNFLISLEFKSKGDRLIINVLKSLGFLDDSGKPIDRYFTFLDQSQSAIVLAEGIEEAYEDLFAVNRDAHKLTQQQVIGKFKTLTQGKYSDEVLKKMGSTFTSLCKLADFETLKAKPQTEENDNSETPPTPPKEKPNSEAPDKPLPSNLNFGGLVYNIQIVLPESRDPKVYDALFKSLREHLK